jgi:tRNA A37 threonylcarbamoyladenosine modification protein TsaB
MDARKKRVYTAAFRGGERIREDADTELMDFLNSLPAGEAVLVTGPDAQIVPASAQVTLDPQHNSGQGRYMVAMAESLFRSEGADPPDLGPLYLRLSEAEEALESGS